MPFYEDKVIIHVTNHLPIVILVNFMCMESNKKLFASFFYPELPKIRFSFFIFLDVFKGHFKSLQICKDYKTKNQWPSTKNFNLSFQLYSDFIFVNRLANKF